MLQAADFILVCGLYGQIWNFLLKWIHPAGRHGTRQPIQSTGCGTFQRLTCFRARIVSCIPHHRPHRLAPNLWHGQHGLPKTPTKSSVAMSGWVWVATPGCMGYNAQRTSSTLSASMTQHAPEEGTAHISPKPLEIYPYPTMERKVSLM